MPEKTKCRCDDSNSQCMVVGVEYSYGHKHRYDGVSEYLCRKCKRRVGRWSGVILEDDETERPFGGQS